MTILRDGMSDVLTPVSTDKKVGVECLLSSRDVEGNFILGCCRQNFIHEQHLNSKNLRLSSEWAHGKGLGYWSTVDFAWRVFRTLDDQDLAVFTHFYARYCNEEWRRRLIAPWLDHLVWADVRVFNYGQRISSRAVSRPSRYPQGERNLTLIVLMWRIGWAHNNARK